MYNDVLLLREQRLKTCGMDFHVASQRQHTSDDPLTNRFRQNPCSTALVVCIFGRSRWIFQAIENVTTHLPIWPVALQVTHLLCDHGPRRRWLLRLPQHIYLPRHLQTQGTRVCGSALEHHRCRDKRWNRSDKQLRSAKP